MMGSATARNSNTHKVVKKRRGRKHKVGTGTYNTSNDNVQRIILPHASKSKTTATKTKKINTLNEYKRQKQQQQKKDARGNKLNKGNEDRKNRRRHHQSKKSGITRTDKLKQHVDCIVGVRKNGTPQQREYLVRWKNLSSSYDTWETSTTLMIMLGSEKKARHLARQFVKTHATRIRQASDAELLMGIVPREERKNEHSDGEVKHGDKVLDVEYVGSEIERWDLEDFDVEAKLDRDIPSLGNQLGQVKVRDVERLNVHDPETPSKVTEARINGIPIVLTGHSGWPQFARRWIKPTANEKTTTNYKATDSSLSTFDTSSSVDLSEPHELNVTQMIDDIGNETVPILKKNYDERNPIPDTMLAKKFLQKYWSEECQNPLSVSRKLYLHQWQFPNSSTAARILCGSENCAKKLPNNIFHDDLLQYWLDSMENPFQYIFMGGMNTMSKLHKDNGGLEITIAPIVGQKECILVHRLDGDSCLYKLNSKLDGIDLNEYPLTAFARVWKTIVHPGEILLMPYGTYHQCRNVTPCLSYHKFHLDVVNIKPFLESLFAVDAPEIDHHEVIWNGCEQLVDQVLNYLKEMKQKDNINPSQQIRDTVETLRILRHVCKEIANRLEQHQLGTAPLPKKSVLNEDATSPHWQNIVQDIDKTLHYYTYRNMEHPPRFKVRNVPLRRTQNDSDDDSSVDDEEKNSNMSSPFDNDNSTRYHQLDIEKVSTAIQRLPLLQPFQNEMVIADSCLLAVGDEIILKLDGRQISGAIRKVVDQMRAAFVKYDTLPSYYDEYQPIENMKSELDVPSLSEEHCSPMLCGNGHDNSSHHHHHQNETQQQKKRQQVAYCSVGGIGEPLRCSIQSTKCATFYLVNVKFNSDVSMKRWFCRQSIIGKHALNQKDKAKSTRKTKGNN